MIATTPRPPYYAVIFSSVRTSEDNGYTEMAERMIDLAKLQDGFLGMESARNELGLTTSYWRDLESIKKWKDNVEHLQAQEQGRGSWYQQYAVRIARVEKEYQFLK